MRLCVGLLVICMVAGAGGCDIDGFDSERETEEFERLSAAAREWKGRTDYELLIRSPDGFGEPPSVVSLHQRGRSDERRFDFKDEESTTTILTTSTSEIACSTDVRDIWSDDDRTGGACASRVPGEGTSVGNVALVLALTFSPVLSTERDRELRVTSAWEDRVLDIAVKCFALGDNRSPSFCFTAEGQLMSTDFDSGIARFRTTAINVAAITDADFEPPYPIIEPD